MTIPSHSKIIGEVVFFVLKIITCLPTPFYSFGAFIVSKTLSLIGVTPSRYFERNVKHVLGYEVGSKEYIEFKKNYIEHQVYCTMESFVGMMWPQKITFDHTNHHIPKGIPNEKPVVLITGHIGAWELLSFSLDGFSKPLLLAKPTKYKWVNYLLDKMRSKGQTRILWVDSEIASFKSIMKSLKSNQTVGFVFDQKSKNRKGPQVKFFGYETDFVSGPALFAHKTNAVVAEIYCIRTGRFQYALQSEYLDVEDKVKDVNRMTQFLAFHLEKKIKEYPLQWLWQYHKWTHFHE